MDFGRLARCRHVDGKARHKVYPAERRVAGIAGRIGCSTGAAVIAVLSAVGGLIVRQLVGGVILN